MRRRLLSHLPLALMCAFVLREGILATHGLEWPFDRDAFRNIAQAQTAADGGWLADPFFQGEAAFYNPLLAWVVAAFSLVTGHPVHVSYTALGPFINLLGPVCFHALVARWFGPVAATASTFHLLFLNVRLGRAAEPFWANPTYSAWMLGANLAQPLFCLTLLALGRAIISGRFAWFATAGALCGLTFLAHTGPVVLLGILLAFETARRLCYRRPSLLVGPAAFAACAALVSSPFLSTIVGRYGLQVRNPDPFFWRWLPPLAECGPVLLHQLSAFSLLGVAGLVLLISRRAPRVPRRHFLVLLLACAVFFVAPFVEERFPSRLLRSVQLVSQHHFWSYLRLFESVLVGFAVAVLGRRLCLSWPRRSWRASRWLRVALASGLVLVGLGLVHSSYRNRVGFALGRAARLDFARDERSRDRTEIVAWLRRATLPSEVFVASDSVSLMVVGPAGRRSLALEPNFASQYVDVIPRYRARGALLLALASGNHEAAARVAAKWGVRYLVLWNGQVFERGDAAAAGLEPAFESRSYRVLRLP